MYRHITKYVPLHIVDQFNQSNRPFKPIQRSCETCHETIDISHPPIFESQKRVAILEQVTSLIRQCIMRDGVVTSKSLTILSQFQADSNRIMRKEKLSIANLHRHLLNDFNDYFDTRLDLISDEYNLNEISRLLVTLETNPKDWKDAQFVHINTFKKAAW